MLFELILVAAFALFPVFAWIKITDAEQKADFYRDRYQECLEELELRQNFQRADSEQVSRLWEEADTRRMEVKGLEHQLQDALDENEAPHEKLGADVLRGRRASARSSGDLQPPQAMVEPVYASCSSSERSLRLARSSSDLRTNASVSATD